MNEQSTIFFFFFKLTKKGTWHCSDGFIINIQQIFIMQYLFGQQILVQWQKKPPKVSCKKGVLESFANLTEKHLRWSLFLIKLQAWRPILRSIKNYFVEHLRWLLLQRSSWMLFFVSLLLTLTHSCHGFLSILPKNIRGCIERDRWYELV